MTTDLDLLQSYRNCRSRCRLLEPYKTKILKSTTKCRKLGRNDFGLRVRSFVINVFRTFRCIRSFIPFSLPFLPSPTLSSSLSLSLCLPRRMYILLRVKTKPVTRSACLIHATRVTSFYVSYSPLLFLSFLFFFRSWEGKREGSVFDSFVPTRWKFFNAAASSERSMFCRLSTSRFVQNWDTQLSDAFKTARIPLIEFASISRFIRVSHRYERFNVNQVDPTCSRLLSVHCWIAEFINF